MRAFRATTITAATCVLFGLAAGCSGKKSAEISGGGDTVDTGSSFFFTDPNAGGDASSFRLSSVSFGRLVQLSGIQQIGLEQIEIPMGSDFVIRQSLESDANYELSRNDVTGQEILIIKRDVTTNQGRNEFIELARAAGENLDTIPAVDLDHTGIFGLLPRNAALVMQFDDLLKRSTIDRRTVEITQGYPPVSPFEARVFASDYYGDERNGRFYPTRIVYDLTTSEIEAFNQTGGEILPINGVGLAASLNAQQPNTQLRIPTRTAASIGITKVLTNLSNNPMATSDNGPVDFGVITQPVTRAMRSGGRADLVDDPFNGFLKDEDAPRVVGSTPIEIPMSPQQQPESPTRFLIPRIVFESQLCGSSPQSEDVIVQPGVFARVISETGAPPLNGVVEDVLVDLILWPDEWVNGARDFEQFGAVSSTYESGYDPVLDAPRAACYVQVSPTPTGFPEAPTSGVFTDSTFTLRFSEPMDQLSLTAFDSVTLTRSSFQQGTVPTSDYVVGRVTQSADLRTVTFDPDQKLAHQQGSSELYYFTLADADASFPPLDLAGNVVEALPEVPMQLHADQQSEFNGGRVSRFTDIDEELPEGAEWGGQILIDSARELLRPRPVVRTQVPVDNTQAVMAQMTNFPQGVVTPFSNFGSKMQTIWRYCDCGFSLTDFQNQNIDIEGLNWSPVNGAITQDSFDQFEIRLGHCKWAPDEVINPQSLFPRFQNSGLRPNYEANPLDFGGTSQQVVHDRTLGYFVSQGDISQTSTGTPIVPFPLNRTVDPEDRRYFTWRDTSIRTRAGSSNGGVEPHAYQIALGQPIQLPPYFPQGQVQTIGLPLLMEFRTFPDPNAIGLNAWDLNLAVNSSSRPYFRAFSTGGVNQSGSNVFIDPAGESSANGGFSPGSTPPGAVTFGRDNTIHLGAIDYVTRVSRAHSIWFEATIDSEPNFTTRNYRPPTFEPSLDAQPLGTSIDIDFRGATSFVYLDDDAMGGPGNQDIDDNDGDPMPNGIIDFTEDAMLLDLYGDYYNDREGTLNHRTTAANPGLNFLTGGSGEIDDWRDTEQEINGARYYQIRLTFLSDAATGLSPELAALALTWSR